MLEDIGEWGYYGGLGSAQPAVGAQRLDGAEAVRLLASVGYGAGRIYSQRTPGDPSG
ncbi:MAG TPA: hypothetical protein VEF72_05355 [Mycobacterium sp.]|nr:hypothetical protein [Mycobacterium sp.]